MRRLMALFLAGLLMASATPVLLAHETQGARTRTEPKAVTVYVTRTGKKYHRSGW